MRQTGAGITIWMEGAAKHNHSDYIHYTGSAWENQYPCSIIGNAQETIDGSPSQ